MISLGADNIADGALRSASCFQHLSSEHLKLHCFFNLFEFVEQNSSHSVVIVQFCFTHFLLWAAVAKLLFARFVSLCASLCRCLHKLAQALTVWAKVKVEEKVGWSRAMQRARAGWPRAMEQATFAMRAYAFMHPEIRPWRFGLMIIFMLGQTLLNVFRLTNRKIGTVTFPSRVFWKRLVTYAS